MIEDAGTPTKLPGRPPAAPTRLARPLAAAGERRAKADALRTNLEDELAVMQDDRSRLAAELDGAIARAESLELANDEVVRRLNGASSEIGRVLGEAGRLSGKG